MCQNHQQHIINLYENYGYYHIEYYEGLLLYARNKLVKTGKYICHTQRGYNKLNSFLFFLIPAVRCTVPNTSRLRYKVSRIARIRKIALNCMWGLDAAVFVSCSVDYQYLLILREQFIT